MSDTVAQRVLDSEVKTSDPKSIVRLSELYGTLSDSIWSELRTGRDITPMRRNLQREHLARLATSLLRPSMTMPADARSLQREQARALRRDIAAAQNRASFSKEAKAHLAEAQNQLDEALKAPIVRQGV